MFIGFAGKAYDRMIDRTIEKPASRHATRRARRRAAVSSKSAFAFGDYTFLYENLIHTVDDHKDAVTAQVGIWTTARTSRPSTRRSGTTTRATADDDARSRSRVRASEDVYLVLTGYDLDSQRRTSASIINPLICWVWIGFLDPRVRHARLSDPAGRRRSAAVEAEDADRPRGRRRHPRR